MRRPALDMLYLAGVRVPVDGHRYAAKNGPELGMRVKIALPAYLPYGIEAAIDHWHRTQQLVAHTHVVLEGHGFMRGGKHWIEFGEQGKWAMETLTLVRKLREGGLQYGLPYWDGCIEIHSCFSGQMRNELSKIQGPHFSVGGKKEVFFRMAWLVMAHTMELLSQEKKNARPGSVPEAIFEHARQYAPTTVAMVGSDIVTMLSHVRTPADVRSRLANAADMAENPAVAEAYIVNVFQERLTIGKLKHVKQMINEWPWLLHKSWPEAASAFSAALLYQRWDMAELLLGYEHANWSVEADALSMVAAMRPDVSARALQRLLQAFETQARIELARRPFPAGDMLTSRALDLSLLFVIKSLERIPDRRALLESLHQGPQYDNGRFSCVWNVMGCIGMAAASLAQVPHGTPTDAFVERLREALIKSL